jgi:hypothetical protein
MAISLALHLRINTQAVHVYEKKIKIAEFMTDEQSCYERTAKYEKHNELKIAKR